MHQELRHYHIVFQSIFTLLGASQHGTVPVLLTSKGSNHFQVCPTLGLVLLSLVLPLCPSSLSGITLPFSLFY